ncbi:MAG: hypothetical protein JW748_05360 [Anaerolineales bacterium]|nr:hypothetical protein [Anaerolineales bacterium]
MNDELPLESSVSGPALKPILFNMLSIFFLGLSCLCPVLSLMIFAAPSSPLNPLPPGGGFVASLTPTFTQTPIIEFPPTWTPTVLPETNTPATRAASRTSGPTDTPVYNLNPQDTPKPFFPFIVEGGNPTYSASPKGCSWLGVAGAIYDLSHNPLDNLLVQLQGKLSGNTIELEQITGQAAEGQGGGFEFQLADEPVLSLNALRIQVLDGNRNPISDKIVFNTYAACDKNLITVVFIQVNP